MEAPVLDKEEHHKMDLMMEEGPFFHYDLCDSELVHKIALILLTGLASACVYNTTGDLFKSPDLVAVDMRKEMVDYLIQQSATHVVETVIEEDNPDAETSTHPTDIIEDFIDDFTSTKWNMLSRVSGWLLSERREDKIDDFVQEMEINGFWLLDSRESVTTRVNFIEVLSAQAHQIPLARWAIIAILSFGPTRFSLNLIP